MKRYIALLLGLVLIMSIFSGCSIVIAGVIFLSPYIEELLPTEAPTDPPENVEPTVAYGKKQGSDCAFPAYCWLL